MNLINEIDNYLIQKESRERTSYYPSEVSQCLRKQYYKWTKETETNPISAGGYWKMKMGNKIHELINEFLVAMGYEIIKEISVKKDIGCKYPISGRVDNIFIDNGDMSGIEVKSGYGNGIRAIRKENYPRKDDIEQIILYMGLTDIIKFYLIYIARDDGYRCQFEIIKKIDDNYYCEEKKCHTNYEDLILRFKMLETDIETKTIPNREYRVAIKNGEIRDKFQKDNEIYKTDWQCSYCQYKDYCWQDELSKYKDLDNSDDFK